MAFKLLGGGSTLDTVVSDMNQNILELKNREVTEIFKDATGTRRVVIDSNGLRTSKAGVDVMDATADQLTFNSSQNTLKVVKSGTYVLNKPVNVAVLDQTVAHGLSYIPALVYNVEQTTIDPGQWRLGLSITGVSAAGTLSLILTASVDSTNIHFKVVAPSSGADYAAAEVYTFKYYLLQETAN